MVSEQHVLAVAERAAAPRGAAAPREIEGPARASAASARRARPRARASGSVRRGRRRPAAAGRRRGLVRPPATRRRPSTSGEAWCAAPRGGARSRARRRASAAASSVPSRRSAARDVVGGARRLELVEEPQPLLGERERQCGRRAAHARSSGGAAGLAGRRRQRLDARAARLATRRRLEERAQRQLHAERARGAATITCVASSEWPPSSKKSSCDADPLDEPEHLGARSPASSLLDRRARRHDAALLARAALRAPAAPGGRPCRSASAAARRARRTPPGTMYSGSRSPQERAQLAAGGAASPRAGTHVGDQARVARRRPRGRPPPPRAPPGARRSAASISPSSMRKPRILTWWSMRPRNSSVAVRRAGAPGRRCGRAARPALGRTGRGRSARRSAPAGPGSRAPAPAPPMYSSPGTPTGTRLAGARRARGPRGRGWGAPMTLPERPPRSARRERAGR